MRIIKFRGKGLYNDRWYYGDIIHDENLISIRFNVDSPNVDSVKMTVIPETVGQFTGLTDKNEVEIYEGDIVNSKFTCEKYKVYYNESEVVFVGSPLTSGCETECWLDSTLEVVGNIHDNPELLK